MCEVFEGVRKRWPENRAELRCEFGLPAAAMPSICGASIEFNLLMIEQPLWYDDFYFHSMLQKRLDTPICLDESIRNRRDALAAIEMESLPDHQHQAGTRGRVSAKRSRCTMRRRSAAFRYGAAGCWSRASGGRTTSRCRRWRTSRCRAMFRRRARYWAEDIIEPEVTVSRRGRDCDSGYAGARVRGGRRTWWSG